MEPRKLASIPPQARLVVERIARDEDPSEYVVSVEGARVAGDMMKYLAQAKRVRDAQFPDFPWVFFRLEGYDPEGSPEASVSDEAIERLRIVKAYTNGSMTPVRRGRTRML